jgi:tripartite-type tricarboxylate transporter receptor subunit TctC
MPRFLRLAGVLATALGIALPAAAQDYPARNVKIIVPFGAGGPADVYARFLGQHLSESLKRSFIIENRPGAGALIGTDEVAKATPDGYTLLMMSNTHTTNETLIPNRNYQLMRRACRQRISRNSSRSPRRSRGRSTTPRQGRARPITWPGSSSKA